MPQATVFISYSHKDEEWKDRLMTHLKALQMEDTLNVWDDRRITAGQDWKGEVEKAIASASVAILLISADFLASKFIRGKEVPPLLRRRENEGLRIFPVIVNPCSWKRIKWLAEIQARPTDGRALSAGDEHQINADLAAIAEEVADIIEAEEQERQEAIEEHLNGVRTAFGEGAYSEAHHLLDEILKDNGIDPDNSEARRLRSEAKAEEEAQSKIEAHRQGAEAAFAKRQYDEAIALWNKLLKLAPDDEEAKKSIAHTQNLLELQGHLKELEEAVADGKDETAVQRWESISSLLPEGAESAYDKQIASLERKVGQHDGEVKKLKAAIQEGKGQSSNLESEKRGLLQELEAKDGEIGVLKKAEGKAARQAQTQADQMNALETQLKKAQDELKNLRPPKRTKKLPSGLVRRDGKIFSEVDGAEMVLIPGGKFQMGSNNGYDGEKPVNPVSLDAFYMDVYPVTVGQYRRFIEATGHRSPNWETVTKYARNDDHPIICVSWRDAMTYCKWAGKILPTEAQWEYAARGKLEGKQYPWGDAPSDETKANYGFKVGKTTPVGKYPKNGYGLYDMAGNVWEWCLDEWDANFYSKNRESNPVAGDKITIVNNDFTNVKTSRVLRGGSWNGVDHRLRVAGRFRYNPAYRYRYFGFRCAVRPSKLSDNGD